MQQKDIPRLSTEFTPLDGSMLIPSLLIEPMTGTTLSVDHNQQAAIMLQLNPQVNWDPTNLSDPNEIKLKIK